MDENTRAVLTTAIQVGGGLVTGIVVAYLGLRHTRALDADRAAREQAARWLSDRREAYSAFLLAANEHHYAISDRINNPDADVVDERTPGLLGSADAPMENLRLVGSPPVRNAAARLYGRLIALDVMSRRPIEPELIAVVESSRDELMGLWTTLYRAIHEDLGIPPDEPELPASAGDARPW